MYLFISSNYNFKSKLISLKPISSIIIFEQIDVIATADWNFRHLFCFQFNNKGNPSSSETEKKLIHYFEAWIFVYLSLSSTFWSMHFCGWYGNFWMPIHTGSPSSCGISVGPLLSPSLHRRARSWQNRMKRNV